jgi:hypothetical protein
MLSKLLEDLLLENEHGAIGGMRNGKGNRSTRTKPVPVHFVHQKSHMTDSVFNLGRRRRGKPATDRLCYDTAIYSVHTTQTFPLRNVNMKASAA